MSKVIAAFLGAEVRQTGAEERPEGFGGSTAGGAHEGFELREAEFNGIEVRTVGRQIAERGADALDRLADAGHFVCAEVIGDDDVPGMQGGHTARSPTPKSPPILPKAVWRGVRAREPTLDRDVALKVLPRAFTEDPERLAVSSGKPKT